MKEYAPDREVNQAFIEKLCTVSTSRSRESNKATVQEVLKSLGNPFKIIHLRDLNELAESGYETVTQLEDGDLLTYRKTFSNGYGVTHNYLLHRHGENIVYNLRSVDVRSSNHPNLEDKSTDLSLA